MSETYDKLKITIKQSEYFAELFSNYDGETEEEQKDNYRLGLKAVLYPSMLTPKEAFIVSFIIERMQNSGYGDMCKLESIKNDIIKNLK